MAVDVKKRKRAARLALWLSAIAFGALVAAVIVGQLPDWIAPLVFVAGFLLGGNAVGRIFAVFVAATSKVAEKKIAEKKIAQQRGHGEIPADYNHPAAVQARREATEAGKPRRTPEVTP